MSNSSTATPSSAKTPAKGTARPSLPPATGRVAPQRKAGAAAKPAAALPRPGRAAVVAASLVIALGATAGLLAALAPAPLRPDAVGRLFAAADVTTAESAVAEAFAPIFETDVPPAAGRWQYIYVRHSGTPAGTASDLVSATGEGPADHFVIGNGQGCGDGEIQYTPRWTRQQPAGSPAPGTTVSGGGIAICLVGDFDRTPPTAAQRRHLGLLIAALQERLDIPANKVVWRQVEGQSHHPAALGRLFPTSDLSAAMAGADR